eukprot:UN07662
MTSKHIPSSIAFAWFDFFRFDGISFCINGHDLGMHGMTQTSMNKKRHLQIFTSV